MVIKTNGRLAVLIDADNAPASIATELFTEISRYGTASIRRAYGNWTTSNLQGWKEVLNRLAIQPFQQFSYTTGKNATDSSLIIDAMDILYDGQVDGFCLVSSDSDFTRLATRLRESGLVVYGFGEEKTPEPFVSACDKFIYTEILRPKPPTKQVIGVGPKRPPIKEILVPAVRETAKENGWSTLAEVGAMISKNNPSFDARNYGFSKLGELVRNQSYLEVSEKAPNNALKSNTIYVRLK